MSTSVVFLHPRPYERRPGTLLLLPLLPHPKPLTPLPSELWAEIITYALQNRSSSLTTWGWSFMTVCRAFRDIALPLLYAQIHISGISALGKFYSRLHIADQKWDSIRRIPFSAPGRWVQVLDISQLTYFGNAEALKLDSLLTSLFPLLPFLSSLSLNPTFPLSRRALAALAGREGSANIRSLQGISYPPPNSSHPDDDPFVQLLKCCPNLEELEIIGQGVDLSELEFNIEVSPYKSFKPLHLPQLRYLCMLSMSASPLLLALLHSSLPSLQKLTITPYDDIPYPASLATAFIATHGTNLRSLLLFTPKSWPSGFHPSPHNVLDLAPNLRHLSLEKPLPMLRLTTTENHSLQILSIPRPDGEFWGVIEKLIPQLPKLSIIRTRDVRWLRKGMTSMAREAGVQGEMREWTRRLRRKAIRVVDADWNENV